jgi:hypothetical protein
MDTPTSLKEKLRMEEAITTAIEVHKAAQQAINEYETVKEQAKIFVRAYLTQTGRQRGKIPAGSFGLTKPTTTYRVNEDKWQMACNQDPGLAAIQKQFDAARQALDEAQRDFLEEVTPEPVVYIR